MSNPATLRSETRGEMYFSRLINCRLIYGRYPRGKASLLLFLLNVFAMFTIGSALVNIFKTKGDTSFKYPKLFFQYGIDRMFYPVTGLIADVYIGRFKMLWISFVLLFSSNLITVIAFSLEVHSYMQIVSATAFLFLSVGLGAIEATIIPFGVDQLQGASSAEISSYLYFFYMSRNIGLGSSVIISPLISFVTTELSKIGESPTQLQVYGAFQPLTAAILLTIGLIMMICLKHWFFKNILWENPVKLIAKVLYYAATVKRHLPIRNRAFRYGEGRKKRIELAKTMYDGEFPNEKVEDVKVFCRVLLILFSLSPVMLSLNAFTILLSQETHQTLKKLLPNSFLEVELYPNIYWVINCVTVVIFLPVINFLFIPCLPRLTIRARIGIGLVLYCIGGLTVVVVHLVPVISDTDRLVSHISFPILIILIVIFALAEVLTSVSVLEFIYAQSPESMKGLLTGLFYFFMGLTSIPSSVLFYLYYQDTLEVKALLPFHGATTILLVTGTVFYVVVASLYINRERHDNNSLQERLIIENQINSLISVSQ